MTLSGGATKPSLLMKLCERLCSRLLRSGFYDRSVAGFHFCGAGGGPASRASWPTVSRTLQGRRGR